MLALCPISESTQGRQCSREVRRKGSEVTLPRGHSLGSLFPGWVTLGKYLSCAPVSSSVKQEHLPQKMAVKVKGELRKCTAHKILNTEMQVARIRQFSEHLVGISRSQEGGCHSGCMQMAAQLGKQALGSGGRSSAHRRSQGFNQTTLRHSLQTGQGILFTFLIQFFEQVIDSHSSTFEKLKRRVFSEKPTL